MDKLDIVDIVKKIGIFEIFIVFEEDCCSVFFFRKFVIKFRLEKIEKFEIVFDIEKLV